MEQNYVNESFLDCAVGNFRDSIQNLVFKFQVYIDNFYNHIPAIYKMIETEDSALKKIIYFLINESENIIKIRALQFIIETQELLNRKYTSLRTNLTDPNNKDLKFEVSLSAYKFFTNQQDLIDWKCLNNVYGKKDHNFYDLQKYVEYMNSKFEYYDNLVFQSSGNNYTTEDILTLIDTGLYTVNETVQEARKRIETSSSMYSTSLIVRLVIDILVLTCSTKSNIHISNSQ